MKKDSFLNHSVFFILLFIGLIWLRSGLGKIDGGNFPWTLSGTLQKFAEKNPYPIIKGFLESFAIPNAAVLGLLIVWGEIVAGVALIVGSLYLLSTKNIKNQAILLLLIIGLLTGMFLNKMFWLAAGYTSPSTDGLNLLMFVIQFIGLLSVIKLIRNR